MKISLGLVIALFVLGVIVNLTQHGHATAWTWLGYAPLLAYVLVWFVLWGISAIRKPKPPTTLNSFALPLLLFVPAAGLPVLLWAIGLLALGFVAKAAVDNLTHQAGNSIFERWGAWFDARTSWKNKYRAYDAGDLRPRFPLATTVLVLLTDFWHAADSVYLTAYLLGGMLLGAWLGPGPALPWVLAVVGVKAVGGGVFQVCYRKFRISKLSSC